MPKSKGPRKKKKSSAPLPPNSSDAAAPNQGKPSLLRRAGKAIFWTFDGVLVLAGAVSLYFEFVPAVAIAVHELPNQQSAMPALFIISNSGILPLYEVNVVCEPAAMKYQGPHSGTGWQVGGKRTTPANSARILRRNESMTTECPEPIRFSNAPLVAGQLHVAVDYLPFHRLWTMTDRAKFAVRVGDDGVTHWVPRPLD